MAHHLVERVEVPTGALERFQRFGQLPDRGDGLIGDAIGTSFTESCRFEVLGFMRVRHAARIPRGTQLYSLAESPMGRRRRG